MKDISDKIKLWLIFMVYALLAITSEILVWKYYTNPYLFWAAFAYIISPILAVTYGAVLFRVCILGIIWAINNLGVLFNFCILLFTITFCFKCSWSRLLYIYRSYLFVFVDNNAAFG